VVLEAVRQNGEALQFASDELKNDKEIVLHAVNNSLYSLQFANIDIIKEINIRTMSLIIPLGRKIHNNTLVNTNIRNIIIQIIV
jgi:hypothetical protein